MGVLSGLCNLSAACFSVLIQWRVCCEAGRLLAKDSPGLGPRLCWSFSEPFPKEMHVYLSDLTCDLSDVKTDWAGEVTQ